jgi:hypothetical protein
VTFVLSLLGTEDPEKNLSGTPMSEKLVVHRGIAATKYVGPNPSTDGFGPRAGAARPYRTRKTFAACEEDCN